MFALFIATLLLAVPDRPMEAKAKDTWVGKVVFVRDSRGVLDPADEPRGLQPNTEEAIPLFANQYRVYAERPDYVQIKTRDGLSGWVRKADLVPLEDAVQFFSRQIEAKSDDVSAYYRRASAWRFRGELDAALKDMNEAIRLSPNSASYNNRALIWHAKRDYDRAIADYDMEIKLYGGSPLTHINRANSWLAKRDFDKAIADATRALELQAGYPEALHVRGIAWHEKKQYDKAIADFNRTIERDKKHAQAYAGRASAWAAKNDHAKALDDFNQALRLEPTNATAIANAALWLASCPDQKYRDGTRALELARQAQKLEPSNSLALQALAAAHAELGQFKEAVRWQVHALQDPQLKSDAVAGARLESYRNKKPWRPE